MFTNIFADIIWSLLLMIFFVRFVENHNTLIQDCPVLSGEEETKQLLELWRRLVDINETTATATDLAYAFAFSSLQNHGLTLPLSAKIVSGVTDYQVIKAARGYVVRVVLKETLDGKTSTGGSSFRGVVRGKTTRTPCATRDYFNGTYLMCCSVMEDLANFTITHDYHNFQGLEFTDRHLERLITNKVIRLDGDTPKILRTDQHSCTDVSMECPEGYWWYNQDEKDWSWVVDGCIMQPMDNSKATTCIHDKFNDRVTTMGDSHARNLFFYVMTYIDPTYEKIEKTHHDVVWNKHYFYWTTTSLTLMNTLREYTVMLEREASDPGHDSTKRYVLLMDMGVWQVISRPVFDYVISVDLVLPMLQRLREEFKVTIIWQNMPSGPLPEFRGVPSVGLPGKNRSNYGVTALNYIICQLVAKVGVKCVPNGLYTHAWTQELACGSGSHIGTHTMCTRGEQFLITPPGHAASQRALSQMCTTH